MRIIIIAFILLSALMSTSAAAVCRGLNFINESDYDVYVNISNNSYAKNSESLTNPFGYKKIVKKDAQGTGGSDCFKLGFLRSKKVWVLVGGDKGVIFSFDTKGAGKTIKSIKEATFSWKPAPVGQPSLPKLVLTGKPRDELQRGIFSVEGTFEQAAKPELEERQKIELDALHDELFKAGVPQEDWPKAD